MRPPLVLVGASGLAREAVAALSPAALSSAGRSVFGGPRLVVVVDDDESLWGTTLGGARVVGGLDKVLDVPSAGVVVTIGSGVVRRRVVERLRSLGVQPRQFESVLHPRVHVPPGCRVGRGSVLLEGAVLTADVTVGEHAVVMPHVALTHDCVLEDYATVCAGVMLGGGVRVGEGAYVGMTASVRPGVRIGADAVVGMGAVVLEDVPAGQTWAGLPARPLRPRMGAVS